MEEQKEQKLQTYTKIVFNLCIEICYDSKKRILWLFVVVSGQMAGE